LVVGRRVADPVVEAMAVVARAEEETMAVVVARVAVEEARAAIEEARVVEATTIKA
jgi:hypothetical protein